jgi:hypothetical protein
MPHSRKGIGQFQGSVLAYKTLIPIHELLGTIMINSDRILPLTSAVVFPTDSCMCALARSLLLMNAPTFASPEAMHRALSELRNQSQMAFITKRYWSLHMLSSC